MESAQVNTMGYVSTLKFYSDLMRAKLCPLYKNGCNGRLLP